MPEHSRSNGSGDEHQQVHETAQPSHESVHYETSEASLAGVVLVLCVIATTFVLVGLIAWWRLAASQGSARLESDASSYSQPTGKLPRPPRLESLRTESTELSTNVFSKQLLMERILHSYGRTSEESYVRIPIAEAIKMTAKAAQSREQPRHDLSKSFGLAGGGESSSGRNYEEAPSWIAPAQ